MTNDQRSHRDESTSIGRYSPSVYRFDREYRLWLAQLIFINSCFHIVFSGIVVYGYSQQSPRLLTGWVRHTIDYGGAYGVAAISVALALLPAAMWFAIGLLYRQCLIFRNKPILPRKGFEQIVHFSAVPLNILIFYLCVTS
jgi:hypothetical protein